MPLRKVLIYNAIGIVNFYLHNVIEWDRFAWRVGTCNMSVWHVRIFEGWYWDTYLFLTDIWPLLRGRVHHPLLIVSTKMRIFEFFWFWIHYTLRFLKLDDIHTVTVYYSHNSFSPNSMNTNFQTFFSCWSGVKTTHWNRASKCRNSKIKRTTIFESIESRNR